MQIIVSGQHTDIGASLQNYVRDNLEKTVTKYFENAIRGEVVFSKRAVFFDVEIKVNEGTGTGVIIKSSAEANEAHAAFDQALERVEKQLRRYKSRLKSHHSKQAASPRSVAAIGATKYVLSATQLEEDNEAATHAQDSSLIIAEKPTKLEFVTVAEAVMLMDLANLPALMFINRKDNKLSVVYRRLDGNISWIDSGITMNETGKITPRLAVVNANASTNKNKKGSMKKSSTPTITIGAPAAPAAPAAKKPAAKKPAAKKAAPKKAAAKKPVAKKPAAKKAAPKKAAAKKPAAKKPAAKKAAPKKAAAKKPAAKKAAPKKAVAKKPVAKKAAPKKAVAKKPAAKKAAPKKAAAKKPAAKKK